MIIDLLAALTATVPNARAPARVTHGVGDLVAQRVFAIACGHPDSNDADRLAEDPIRKLLLGRDPIEGGRLASHPTISRFEHTAAPRMLLAMSHALADTVIARFVAGGSALKHLVTASITVERPAPEIKP